MAPRSGNVIPVTRTCVGQSCQFGHLWTLSGKLNGLIAQFGHNRQHRLFDIYRDKKSGQRRTFRFTSFCLELSDIPDLSVLWPDISDIQVGINRT